MRGQTRPRCCRRGAEYPGRGRWWDSRVDCHGGVGGRGRRGGRCCGLHRAHYVVRREDATPAGWMTPGSSGVDSSRAPWRGWRTWMERQIPAGPPWRVAWCDQQRTQTSREFLRWRTRTSVDCHQRTRRGCLDQTEVQSGQLLGAGPFRIGWNPKRGARAGPAVPGVR